MPNASMLQGQGGPLKKMRSFHGEARRPGLLALKQVRQLAQHGKFEVSLGFRAFKHSD